MAPTARQTGASRRTVRVLNIDPPTVGPSDRGAALNARRSARMVPVPGAPAGRRLGNHRQARGHEPSHRPPTPGSPVRASRRLDSVPGRPGSRQTRLDVNPGAVSRILAEREGFEPSIRVTPDTAFPVRAKA